MNYIVHTHTSTFDELVKLIHEIAPSFNTSNEPIDSLVPAKVINFYISGTPQELGQLGYDLIYSDMYGYDNTEEGYYRLLLQAEGIIRNKEKYITTPVIDDNVLNISMYDIMNDKVDVMRDIAEFIEVDYQKLKDHIEHFIDFKVRQYNDEPSAIIVSFPGATGGHFILTILDLMKRANPPYNFTTLPDYSIDTSGHSHNEVHKFAGHYSGLHKLKEEMFGPVPKWQGLTHHTEDGLDVLAASYKGWTDEIVFPRSTTQHWRDFTYFLDNPEILPGHKKRAILIEPTAEFTYDVSLQMAINYFSKVSKVAEQFDETYEKVYFDCVGLNTRNTLLDPNKVIPLSELNKEQMLEMTLFVRYNIENYDVPVFSEAFAEGHARDDTLVLQFNDINHNMDKIIQQLADFFEFKVIPDEVYKIASEYSNKQPTMTSLLANRN